MTRPLRYDESFLSIINEKVHENFLYVFKSKVQSTAFCKQLNLKQSLFIISLFDVVIGLTIFFEFNKVIELTEAEDEFIYVFEKIILLFGILFGLIGIDASANLSKRSAEIYKVWRVLITFSLPLFEACNSILNRFCYLSLNCPFYKFIFITLIIVSLNIYFTKIAWSFCIRLARSQELLIVHGKHLEKMIRDEDNKIKKITKMRPKTKISRQDYTDENNTGMKVNLLDYEQVFNVKKNRNIFSNLKSSK